MADISKIKLNDTTYNIKDTTARAQSGSNATNIVNLQTSMKQAESDIQSVDTRVKALETRKPENMLKKRFVMIADSYGEFGCMEAFASELGGTIVESTWVGGAGFTKTGNQQYLAMLNGLANHNDIDYVVVFGFYNDSFDVNNLRSAIYTFKNQVQEKYPGAQLVLVNQGWSGNVEYQGNFQYLCQALMDIQANNLGIVINTWKYLHIYSNMQSDLIHPTTNAGVIQGGMAAMILAGGNPDVIFPIQQIAPNFINDWQTYGGTTTPYQEMNGSECLLHFVSDCNHYGIDKGTTIKCNGSNYVEIFEFPANQGCIIGSGDMMLNVPCILGETSGNYRMASCTLEIYNRRLRIRPFCLNQTGTDFVTISLNSIQWTPCTIRSNINHI